MVEVIVSLILVVTFEAQGLLSNNYIVVDVKIWIQ